MFLSIDINSVQTIIAIITGSLSILGVLSGVYLKYSKKRKNQQDKKSKDRKKFEDVCGKIDQLVNKVEELNESQKELKQQYAEFENKFDHLETQELRYMINDSFLGYGTIHEVPDDQLLNAADCCEIYLNKGLNHATGARCKLIAEEVDRRARARAGVDTKDAKK